MTLAIHTQDTGTFEITEHKQCEVLLLAKTEGHPLRVKVERV
jgi:hypothetical protein